MSENLWAPWRMAYLKQMQQRMDGLAADGGLAARTLESSAASGNFIHAFWMDPQRDDVNHIVYRDEHGLILLNRYPYANGHLMVAIGEPRPTLLDYLPEQRAAFWLLIEIATELMQKTLRPQGINIGINQGGAAGAGLPEHLHAHLVPRWNGDTNFITVVGDVRVIPEALEEMAKQYRESAQAMRDEP